MCTSVCMCGGVACVCVVCVYECASVSPTQSSLATEPLWGEASPADHWNLRSFGHLPTVWGMPDIQHLLLCETDQAQNTSVSVPDCPQLARNQCGTHGNVFQKVARSPKHTTKDVPSWGLGPGLLPVPPVLPNNRQHTALLHV